MFVSIGTRCIISGVALGGLRGAMKEWRTVTWMPLRGPCVRQRSANVGQHMILLVHGMRKRCLSSSGTSKAKFGPSQQSQCRKNFDLKYLDQKRYQSQSPLARRLNQKGVDAEETSLDDQLAKEKEKQVRTPWHREGATKPPVARQRSAGAMTKGMLIATQLSITQ